MPKETFVREDYRHIRDYEKRCKQAALDYSGGGRCWWIYQYICSSLNVGQRGEKRYAGHHGNKEVCI